MPSPNADEALTHWPGARGHPRPLAGGHINDTYLVGEQGEDPRYVLQRLNSTVFPDPLAVMRNLSKVTAHAGEDFLVAPIPSSSGESFAMLPGGHAWRLFPWLPSRTFQALPKHLLQPAGAAFGRFLHSLRDFGQEFETVIDGFHDLGHVLARLDAAPAGGEVAAELRRVEALRTAFVPGKPSCVVHGDCKINNLLFHPTKDAVAAIVDLDTVMLGDPAWDFGDLVRSAFAGSEETAPAQALSPAGFEDLCGGFADAYGTEFGAGDDVQRFAAAPAYMSLMLAVRFLTDHMEGDLYFKVPERGANLRRARSQLDLAERFLAAKPDLERVVERVARDASRRR